MKKMFTALLVLGSIIQAQATEVVVYYGNVLSYDHYSFLSGAFDTNKKLGRAWVTLDFKPADPEGTTENLRVQIPNMKFDQTTKEVVIETDEGRIVCAYEKRDFFGVRSLKNTNHCRFKQSYSTVSVDDGYVIRKVQKRTITFSY